MVLSYIKFSMLYGFFSSSDFKEAYLIVMFIEVIVNNKNIRSKQK